MCSPDIFLGVIALLFPPLPVWVKCGICSADSVINILLCMLGYLPGLLHSWYIIAKFPENEYEALPQDAEGGRVTYVFVHPNGRQERVPKPNNSTQPNPPGSPYGTTSTAPAAPAAPAVHQQSNGTWANGGEGPSDGSVPPSYAEAVGGDNKIQSNQ